MWEPSVFRKRGAIGLAALHAVDAQDFIFDKMKISHHTLFRNLKADGVTFKTVVEKLGHQMALQYPNGIEISVNKTARPVDFLILRRFRLDLNLYTGYSPRAKRASRIDNALTKSS